MEGNNNGDTAESIVNIVGKTFAYSEAGVEFIETFCTQHSHPVRRVSKATVAQYNIKVKDSRLELLDDQLYSQRWVCKHCGNFKSRSEKMTAREVSTIGVVSSICIWHGQKITSAIS
jgi:hypothetical protein